LLAPSGLSALLVAVEITTPCNDKSTSLLTTITLPYVIVQAKVWREEGCRGGGVASFLPD
jgi:hypothetical protein